MADQNQESQHGNADAANDSQSNTQQGEQPKRGRGFASMDREKQRQIAAKGGGAVSRNREYMASIGK